MLVGGRCVRRWAGRREIYFAMQVSRPFGRLEIFGDGVAVSDAHAGSTAQVKKCVVHNPDLQVAGGSVLVKTGISGVSVDGAIANLSGKIAGWDFDRVRETAEVEWERELGKIRVEGGTVKQKTIFYTALYHRMIAPTLFDDVDGKYRGLGSASACGGRA